jgi:hypothetical protein
MKKSIFSLNTKSSDLKATNQGLSNFNYETVYPIRQFRDTVATNNFTQGPLYLRFSHDSGTWVMLNKSFIVMEIELLNNANAIFLEAENDIAPNFLLPHCMFNKMQFKINQQTISEISENLPQISAYKLRNGSSGEFLNTFINNTGFTDNFYKRKDLLHFKHISEIGIPKKYHITTLGQAANNMVFRDDAGGNVLNHSKYFKIGDLIQVNEITYTVTNVANNDLTILPQPAAGGILASIINETVRFHRSDMDRSINNFQSIFQPCLSIFQINHALPGGCMYELMLNPYNSTILFKNVVETMLTNQTVGVDFQFRVKDLYLQLATCQGPLLEKSDFYLDLSETRCQKINLTTHTKSNYRLTISPSTTCIGIAFQDESVENDTRYSISKFAIQNHEEYNLTEFYLRYDNIRKPQVTIPLELDHSDIRTEKFIHYFIETMFGNNYHDKPSVEKFSEFLDRGLFFKYLWVKDGSSRSTLLDINVQFSQAFTSTPNMLVFNEYSKVVLISYNDFKITKIMINES